MAARLFGREVEPRSRESENDRMVRLGRGSLNLKLKRNKFAAAVKQRLHKQANTIK